MKLEIQDAISSLIPPELLALYLDVVDTLLSQDYIQALDELNTVLMIADDMADSSMLVSRIHDVLVYALNWMLNDRGISVIDTAPLGLRLAVINAVLDIPYYIIPTDLAHIFEEQYDGSETLARLVAFFSNHHLDDLIESIESVADDTLAYLKTSINERIQTMGVFEGGPSPTDRIRLINKLIKTNGAEHFSMLLELANAGVRVGRKYDDLLNISFEGLETRNPQEAASQLVGLAFFSDLPLAKIWTALDVSLNDYTDNPMERKLMLDTFSDIKRKLGDTDAIT